MNIFNNILNQVPVALVVIYQGKICYANKSFLKLISFSKKEIIGNNINKFLLEIKNNKSFFYTFILTKKNTKNEVEVTQKKISHNNKLYWLLAIKETATQKKLERVFQEQDERFYAIAENTPDLIARFDEECRYIYVNRAIEKIYKTNREKIFWKTDKDLGIKKEDRISLQKEIAIAFKEKKKRNFYYKTTINGKKKYYYATLVPEFFPDKTVKSALFIARDITEIKNLDNLKSDFIAITTHQLRSPLSIISWCLVALSEEKNLTVKEKDYLERIKKSTKDLIKITDIFLNTTMLDLEMFILNYKEINVVRCINETISSFADTISKKNISFTKKYSKNLHVKFDERILKIILKVLLSNAVEYTNKKGQVHLTVKRRNNFLFITITDSGCGIKPEEQKKVFTKFYRSKEAQKIRAYGTGLDLYFIRALLKKINGKIKLESPSKKFNTGTTFKVKIPLTKNAV